MEGVYEVAPKSEERRHGGFGTRLLEELEDPRTGNEKRHDLHEIVVIALCTVLCGGETCADIALLGRFLLNRHHHGATAC